MHRVEGLGQQPEKQHHGRSLLHLTTIGPSTSLRMFPEILKPYHAAKTNERFFNVLKTLTAGVQATGRFVHVCRALIVSAERSQSVLMLDARGNELMFRRKEFRLLACTEVSRSDMRMQGR